VLLPCLVSCSSLFSKEILSVYKKLLVLFRVPVLGRRLSATPLYLLKKRKGNGDGTTKIFLFNGFYIKYRIKDYNNFQKITRNK
jgi:hypothetical protein